MTQREKAIQDIEAHYPPDSQYETTNKIGRELLEQAKHEVAGWRTEPTEVLIRFAQLCRQMDARQTAEIMRK